MQSWKLTKPKKLEFEETTDTDLLQDQNYAKIKILLTNIAYSDISVYLGNYLNNKFPICPGRSAIGYISESANTYYKKGQRIFLTPYQKNKSKDTIIAGVDFDGYATNYVTVPINRVVELPDNVKEEAIFIDDIALAYSTLTKLNIEQGEYIILIGASFKNIIAAQLAIYHQSIPIILDDNEERLDIAKSLGIYYTLNKKVIDVKKRILEITSGDFAKYLIFDTDCFTDCNDIISYIGKEGKLCFMGFNKMPNPLNLNISEIIKNEISIVSSSTGEDHITTAINYLANMVIDVRNLIQNTGDLNSFNQFIKTLSTKPTYFKNIIKC